MLCQNCKSREANTHIVRTVGNKTVEMYLCPECARESGFDSDFSISDFLFGSLLSSPFATAHDELCPVCHTSFTEISQSGNVGCEECYHSFASRLTPMISRLHSLPLHKGKTPKGENAKPKEPTPEERIAKLKSEQSAAIKAEDFEKAAKLRDEIKKLEGGKADE